MGFGSPSVRSGGGSSASNAPDAAGIAVLLPTSGGSGVTPTPVPTATLAASNLVMGIGDSITAHGDNGSTVGSNTGIATPSINSLNWLAFATLFGGGKIQYAGISATSGYTTAQILSTHLPKALAAAPGACGVLGGRNDVFQGVSLATTIANLTSIYTQLNNAGILPILYTLTPISTADDAQKLHTSKLNTWIRRYGAKHRWPVIDLFAACVDPLTGEWKTGYNSDISHPTRTGCRAMGLAVAAALPSFLPPGAPNVVSAQFTTAQHVNAVGNALNLLDTDSDGIPDGWSNTSGSGFTPALTEATSDGSIGNWWTINRTSGTNAVSFTGPTLSSAAGAKLGFGFNLMLSGIETGGATVTVALVNSANTGQVICGFSGWNADVTTPGLFYAEGTGIAGTLRPIVTISGGTGLIKLGRVTAINLTANGLV